MNHRISQCSIVILLMLASKSQTDGQEFTIPKTLPNFAIASLESDDENTVQKLALEIASQTGASQKVDIELSELRCFDLDAMRIPEESYAELFNAKRAVIAIPKGSKIKLSYFREILAPDSVVVVYPIEGDELTEPSSTDITTSTPEVSKDAEPEAVVEDDSPASESSVIKRVTIKLTPPEDETFATAPVVNSLAINQQNLEFGRQSTLENNSEVTTYRSSEALVVDNIKAGTYKITIEAKVKYRNSKYETIRITDEITVSTDQTEIELSLD